MCVSIVLFYYWDEGEWRSLLEGARGVHTCCNPWVSRRPVRPAPTIRMFKSGLVIAGGIAKSEEQFQRQDDSSLFGYDSGRRVFLSTLFCLELRVE